MRHHDKLTAQIRRLFRIVSHRRRSTVAVSGNVQLSIITKAKMYCVVTTNLRMSVIALTIKSSDSIDKKANHSECHD